MNTQAIAITFALAAVACSSSSTRPAQDASSSTAPTTTTESETYTASQPVLASSQPRSASTENTADATTTGDKKATGSTYVATKPSAPSAEVTPRADEAKSADNTKTNTRDRHETLTPMDQGNSTAETNITANIRKGIMGDKAVSFTGKNVKVVTVGTKVTLRGPVKSDKERTAIEGIAKRTAGVTDVDNQLEIVN